MIPKMLVIGWDEDVYVMLATEKSLFESRGMKVISAKTNKCKMFTFR